MTEVIILKRDAFDITLYKDQSKFTVNITADVEYNEKGFEEFLEYFKSTWVYINQENEIYYLFINLGICKKEHELPLPAYIKLIKCITDLNNIMVNNCHSICILTEGSEKWENAYKLITKLWNPPEQRPLKFTSEQSEIDMFFKLNKLIK